MDEKAKQLSEAIAHIRQQIRMKHIELQDLRKQMYNLQYQRSELLQGSRAVDSGTPGVEARVPVQGPLQPPTSTLRGAVLKALRDLKAETPATAVAASELMPLLEEWRAGTPRSRFYTTVYVTLMRAAGQGTKREDDAVPPVSIDELRRGRRFYIT